MEDDYMRARDFPTPGSSSTDTSASRSLVANEKIEELIDEVQKRPALYKKDIKQYSDINVKKKLWEEVCEAVISNWAELSVNERKEQGYEIQKKWNNLRTCFARELKAQKSMKSGQAASKRRPYVYFERMLFLVPCMESRPTEGSLDNSESNQDDDKSSDTQSFPQRKRRTRQSDLDEQIIKSLQSNEDDDTNYCLSLVPFMKELTSDEKLDVRIRILQIFQEIKKKRLLPNTSFNIIQPSTSQFHRAPRRKTPSTSVRIISDQVFQPKQSHSAYSTHQTNLSQPLTESHQQSIAGPSYLQLSSPSPETQTPPPPQYCPSPHDQDSIITYWSNFSESESELIDL